MAISDTTRARLWMVWRQFVLPFVAGVIAYYVAKVWLNAMLGEVPSAGVSGLIVDAMLKIAAFAFGLLMSGLNYLSKRASLSFIVLVLLLTPAILYAVPSSSLSTHAIGLVLALAITIAFHLALDLRVAFGRHQKVGEESGPYTDATSKAFETFRLVFLAGVIAGSWVVSLLLPLGGCAWLLAGIMGSGTGFTVMFTGCVLLAAIALALAALASFGRRHPQTARE